MYVHYKPNANGTQFPTRMVEQTPTRLARKRRTCRRFPQSATLAGSSVLPSQDATGEHAISWLLLGHPRVRRVRGDSVPAR